MKDINMVNSEDDNTSYMSANNMTNLIENLEDSANFIVKWRASNQMKRCATKYHILLSTTEEVITNVDLAEMESSLSENLLGATIESQQVLKNISKYTW